jgi:hypothetical protein
MIRLFDLNACEWREYPSADQVPAGNFRTENGMRWVGLSPDPEPTEAAPAAKPARKAKR